MLLRQREVHIHRIERLQRDDGRAVVEKLAEVDLADARPAGERGADGLLGDHGADVVDLGVGLLGLGFGAVEIGRRTSSFCRANRGRVPDWRGRGRRWRSAERSWACSTDGIEFH